MLSLDDHFPRYTDFDPLVPIWCATPNLPGCLHRFFDTSPISPSGRYLAVFQFPCEDRLPMPGEAGRVVVVDLTSGEHRAVAETVGWDAQLGANINWGGSDSELYFNDVDAESSAPFAWKLDPHSGERVRLEGPVYHASPDGRWLVAANLKTMGKTQAGYGTRTPREKSRTNNGPVADDGFYLTDTRSGKKWLLVSFAEIFEQVGAEIGLACPEEGLNSPENFEVYGFHSKFNAQGNRLMLAWLTMRPDGTDLHCALGVGENAKGGHHATWFPDGERISMNLDIDRERMRFVSFRYDGSDLRKLTNDAVGSGHPTVIADGRYLLTDAYLFEEMAFGDGTVPWRWIDLTTGAERTVARIPSAQPCKDSVMRVDPHPAWDRGGRYVAFNAFAGGTRRVFIADMQSLLGG